MTSNTLFVILHTTSITSKITNYENIVNVNCKNNGFYLIKVQVNSEV